MTLINPSSTLSRGQTLSLFLFVWFCFLLLAYRSEVNAHRIAVEAWHSCQNARTIITHFNNQQTKLAEIETSVKQVDPSAGPRRAQVYLDGRLPLRDCGPRP